MQFATIAPLWLSYPAVDKRLANMNFLNAKTPPVDGFRLSYKTKAITSGPPEVVSAIEVGTPAFIRILSDGMSTRKLVGEASTGNKSSVLSRQRLQSGFFVPLKGAYAPATIIMAIVDRASFFDRVPLHTVLAFFENKCGVVYTFRLDTDGAQFQGLGDLHDPIFDSYGSVRN
jgi:hypothetical protein